MLNRQLARWIALAILLAPIGVAGPAAARKAVAAPHYLATVAFDWRGLLDPGPPAANSAAARDDLAAVLRWQAARTPADVDRCRREDPMSPWLFAEVLGVRFTHKECPATDRLLRQAEVDLLFFADSAKERWERPRPPKVDPDVHPCVGKQTTGSFPSSHAARGTAWAAILSALYPDKAAALAAEGQRIGDDRVVAGIHFPTDVAAGQKLGSALAKRLLADPKFQADLEAARAEVAGVVAVGTERRPTSIP